VILSSYDDEQRIEAARRGCARVHRQDGRIRGPAGVLHRPLSGSPFAFWGEAVPQSGVLTVTTAIYILSRGIAKASRVLEQ
jgi:hypothetical protein